MGIKKNIMSTCFGGSCLSMDDLYNFIVDVKNLDLYGEAHIGDTCCNNGNWVGGDCDCSNAGSGTTKKYCMFDRCLTWDQLDDRINWLFGEFDNGDLWFDLPLSLVGAFAWAGTNADLFPNKDGSFWTRFAEISMIFTGAIAAYRFGLVAVQASILATSWGGNDSHSFAGYSGNTVFIGDTLGLFESVFSMLFLAMSAELVAGPLYLAYTMDKKSPTGDLENLMLAAITAMGAFFGGETLVAGVADIIDYFNGYDTGAMDNIALNTTAFVFDIGLHSIESLMYLGLTFLIANGSFQLVYDVLNA